MAYPKGKRKPLRITKCRHCKKKFETRASNIKYCKKCEKKLCRLCKKIKKGTRDRACPSCREKCIQCKICKEWFRDKIGLSPHITKSHKNWTSKKYYDIFLKTADEDICENCGELTDCVGIIGYRMTCSLKCASLLGQSRAQSPEARLKRSKSLQKTFKREFNQDPEYFKKRSTKAMLTKNENDRKDPIRVTKRSHKQSKLLKGQWKTPSFQKLMKNVTSKNLTTLLHGWWKDPKYRKQNSEQSSKVATKTFIAGKSLWGTSFGVSGWYNSIKAGKIRHRSLLELQAYRRLDSEDRIHSFRVEPFQIEYQWQGNTHQYTPDVFAIIIEENDDTNLIKIKGVVIEIKPARKLREERVQAKARAGKRYAKKRDWKFWIWTEKDLKAYKRAKKEAA